MAFLLPGERQMVDKIVTAQKLKDADKDCDALDQAVSGGDSEYVKTRRGKEYPTMPNAIRQIMENGGFMPFATEAELLAYVPNISPSAAKAMDTKKVWLWKDNGWHDTGLSELDQANNNSKLRVDQYDQSQSFKSNLVHTFYNSFNDKGSYAFINDDLKLLLKAKSTENLVYSFYSEFGKSDGFIIADKELKVLFDPTASKPNFAVNDNIRANVDVGDVYLDKQVLLKKELNHPYFYEIVYYGSAQNKTVFPTVQSLYDYYDRLMIDNTEYVSKEQIGSDVTGLPIYAYTIKPKKYLRVDYTEAELKHHKVIVVSGIHGNERTGQINCLLFFANLIDRYKKLNLYSEMRHIFEFVVIPAANPWGVENNSRENSNGVDLNREFYDGGFTQPEAIALRDFVLAQDNLAMYLDLHSGGERSYLLWVGATSSSATKLLKFGTAKMLEYIYSNIEETIESEYSFQFAKNKNNTTCQYFASRGIDTFLIESPVSNPVLGDALKTRECIVQCIAILIHEVMTSIKYLK